jgi:hypothetical protein
MAAARPLPNAALVTITIQPGGFLSAGDANKILGPLDSVSFRNTAGFPVNIIFTNTLTSMTNLAQGASSGAQGGSTPLMVTVNYKIQNYNGGRQTGGPYSIQFGIGALPISIQSLDTNPDPIAIPIGGQIAFDADAEYDIVWKINNVPANVWSGQTGTVSAGQNTPLTALAGANGKTVTYSISVPPELTRGGGTVSIGN